MQNIFLTSSSARKELQNLLDAGEIKIDGHRPSDIKVHDNRFYQRVLHEGSLGLGEAYLDGWWDCEALDDFFTRVLSNGIPEKVKWTFAGIVGYLLGLAMNFPKTKSDEVGKVHYDVGNPFYESMLGQHLAYSCGYWRNACSLDEAQEAKLDLVCRKLKLKRKENVLDIGCGWGSFVKFASEKYGITALGVTISKEQAMFAQNFCRGLPVEIKYQDYHHVKGRFDHVVSIGMFEHVGYKNYKDYMRLVHSVLAPQGLFLLHTIGSLKSGVNADSWVSKYIFPNSMTPSLKQISQSIEGLFVIEDIHNFGADYDRTLMSWYENFERHWPRFRDVYGMRFYRMWKYYLLMAAATFRSRYNQVWQIVLAKTGVPGGYISVR